MPISDLGALGEFIGGIAVIFSFVFLALQIRQNTKAMRAQAARESELEYVRLNFQLASNAELAELLMRFDEEGVEINKFDATERFRYHMHTRAALQLLQTEYYLHLEGSLPDYVWQRRLKWFRGFIELPVPKVFFEEDIAQENFDDGFLKALLAEDATIKVRFGSAGAD